jgi:hypothetical protein
MITVNGKAVAPYATREDGLIAIPVSAGPSTVDVRWSTTEDVILGRWISGIALLLLLALWRIEAGLARRQSSTSP